MASRHPYLSQQLPSETQRIRQCLKQHTHLSAGTYQARGLYKTTNLQFFCLPAFIQFCIIIIVIIIITSNFGLHEIGSTFFWIPHICVHNHFHLFSGFYIISVMQLVAKDHSLPCCASRCCVLWCVSKDHSLPCCTKGCCGMWLKITVFPAVPISVFCCGLWLKINPFNVELFFAKLLQAPD